MWAWWSSFFLYFDLDVWSEDEFSFSFYGISSIFLSFLFLYFLNNLLDLFFLVSLISSSIIDGKYEQILSLLTLKYLCFKASSGVILNYGSLWSINTIRLLVSGENLSKHGSERSGSINLII
jgi:hypothetical protein